MARETEKKELFREIDKRDRKRYAQTRNQEKKSRTTIEMGEC